MIKVDEKQLRKALLEDCLSCKEAGEIFGCSASTISNWAKKYGIELKRTNWPTKEELYEMYVTKRMSVASIAKVKKMGLESIKKLLREYGIGVRQLGANQHTSWNHETVKCFFEEQGCELLSVSYENVNAYLEYVCSCGNTATIRFSAFQRGQRCQRCAAKKRAAKRRHSYEYVKQCFENRGCKLLSTTYENANKKLEYICHCGSKATMTFGNFSVGYDCAECKRRRFLGERNHNYNPNLSDEERLEIGRYEVRYKKFRREVYKRDNFTCVSCGNSKSGTLVAHHLDSYSEHPEKRTDPNNAVTLCDTCHKDFHHIYGYGKNTKEQFEEYIQNK